MSSSMPTLHFIGTPSPSFFRVLHQFLGIHHVPCYYPNGFFSWYSCHFTNYFFVILFYFFHLNFVHLMIPSYLMLQMTSYKVKR